MNEERINAITEFLSKTARLDFTSKMEVTGRGDELDAIAIGLNTVSKEFEAHIKIIEEAEKRFQGIIYNAPEALVVMDEKGLITEWNPKAELIFNWQKEEVIGKALHEIIIPERYHKAHLKGLKHFLESGAGPILNKPNEVAALRRDNTEFDAGLSISPFDYDGKKFFIGFISDISIRKKADEKIKKLNAGLEQGVQESTAALQQKIKEITDYKYALEESSIVAITDQKGIIKHANQNFCNISKYSYEELVGQDHRIINSGQHPKAFIKSLWTTIAKGNIWRGELKNKAKDGTYYWVDTTIIPFLDEKKKPYQYVAIRADITERKELQEQNALYASIISSTDDAVISRDLNGIITSWNNGAEKMFGYTAAEAIGKHIFLIIPNHLRDFEKEIIAKIKKGETLDHYETERKTKKGDPIYVWLSISPIRDLFGNIIGASKISRDLTERIKAEENIRILNEELEKRVKERTEELESFTYSVSHDLRAPLRAVNGYARILEEDYNNLFDTEGKRLLGEVQANATKMGNLIDDLLSFSRLGKQELNRSSINMTELIHTAIKEVNYTAGTKAEIRIGKVLPLQADYNLMLQVMINLLSNAVKYSSRKSKPVVEINSEAGKNEVTYSVRDNGVGFDMEYVHKLFGVFQRLHSSDEFSGTGVGLAIVNRIINKHEGKIWAESKVGKGASFYFSLPCNN